MIYSFTPNPYPAYSCSKNYFYCADSVSTCAPPNVLANNLVDIVEDFFNRSGAMSQHYQGMLSSNNGTDLGGEIEELLPGPTEGREVYYQAIYNSIINGWDDYADQQICQHILTALHLEKDLSSENPSFQELLAELKKCLLESPKKVNDFHVVRVSRPSTPFSTILRNYEKVIRDLRNNYAEWACWEKRDSNKWFLFSTEDYSRIEMLVVLKRLHEIGSVFEALEEKLLRKSNSQYAKIESALLYIKDVLLFALLDFTTQFTDMFKEWKEELDRRCQKNKAERVAQYLETVQRIRKNLPQLPERYQSNSEKKVFKNFWHSIQPSIESSLENSFEPLYDDLTKALDHLSNPSDELICESTDIYGSNENISGHPPRGGSHCSESRDDEFSFESQQGEKSVFDEINPMQFSSGSEERVDWSAFSGFLELEHRVRALQDLSARLKKIENNQVIGTALYHVGQLALRYFSALIDQDSSFYHDYCKVSPAQAKKLREEVKTRYARIWDKSVSDQEDFLEDYKAALASQ